MAGRLPYARRGEHQQGPCWPKAGDGGGRTKLTSRNNTVLAT